METDNSQTLQIPALISRDMIQVCNIKRFFQCVQYGGFPNSVLSGKHIQLRMKINPHLSDASKIFNMEPLYPHLLFL